MTPDTITYTFRLDKPLTLTAISDAVDSVDAATPVVDPVVTGVGWSPHYAPTAQIAAFGAPLPEVPPVVGGTLSITLDTATR